MADAPGGIINDWQDKRILHTRAEISLLFGKILPESGLLAAQGYKIRVFCRTSADAFIRAYSTNHSGAFLPTTSYAFAH